MKNGESENEHPDRVSRFLWFKSHMAAVLKAKKIVVSTAVYIAVNESVDEINNLIQLAIKYR